MPATTQFTSKTRCQSWKILRATVALFVAVLAGGCGDKTTNDTLEDPIGNLSSSQPADANCTDLFSFNDNWADNCVLKRNGLYALSNYTIGVQRILWCLEYADEENDTLAEENTVADNPFVTGQFDTLTEAAVRRYQNARQIPAHGAVGETTWMQLRQELSLLGAAAAEYSSYAINSKRCGSEELFFQRNSVPYDWKIVSPANENEKVDFTVLAPAAGA